MTGINKNDNDILVTVDYDGQLYEIHTYPNEYRSLMMLIYDKISPEAFGECLGMGRCGTCLVEVIDKQHEPTAYERNEDVNLARTGISGENIRLSCQLMIDENLDGLIVKVLADDF